MNWFHFKLCFIVVVFLSAYYVDAEGFPNGEEEQTMDGPIAQKMFTQPARKVVRQSFTPNFSRNMVPNTGFPFAHGLIQGQPLDAEASNKIFHVLNNEKNRFAELAKMAEEPLKRLTRNPDVMDQLLGQAQTLGTGLLHQMGQAAPDMSGSVGQAINDVLAQTNKLALEVPLNVDLDKMANFSELGRNMGQSFIVGASQIFNPNAGPVAPDAAAGEAGSEAESEPAVGAAPDPEPEPEPATAPAPAPAEAPVNPLDQILGSPFLPPLGLNLAPQLPLGIFDALKSFNLLMPLGSEISEVRALPEQYSPYKITPQQVDHQTMAEMKLKAVLKDALTKKTIPILWFHLPSNPNMQKSNEDLEIEAKLAMFEKQVIAELEQLQELSKLANEVKRAQLESGSQPSASLTTKLNLQEIPIYDITLGDIEKTLKDEHVIMLMHTMVQKHNKEFYRHQQATTKYLTDLTGTPIKRQTKTAEDALKTMEKEDILKMMTYAYRNAAASGHEMPWLKKKTDEMKSTIANQQTQSKESNMQMAAERQWLEDKQQHMVNEAEMQRQMMNERKQKMTQNHERQWADPNNMQQQPIERQWANPTMLQQQMPIERQMMPPQMQQQQIPFHRQMLPPQMPHSMPIQNTMHDPNMQMPQQDNQRQMMPQPIMMQPQMPMQRQWVDPINMQQQQRQRVDPNMQSQQRQWLDTNTPETKISTAETKPEQRQSLDSKTPEQAKTETMAEPSEAFKNPETMPEQRQRAEPNGASKNPDTMPEQRQWVDAKTTEQTSPKATNSAMSQRQGEDANMRVDNMPIVGEAKPQMAENAGKARHKGMKDFFDDLNVFDKHKQKEKPTIINYYYNSGGSRYPPIYAAAGGYQAPAAPQSYGSVGGYGGGYAAPPQPSYSAAPNYTPAGGSYGGGAHGSNAYGSYGGGYRSATGDDEIAAMLQQQQTMPKMMTKPNNEEPNPFTTTKTATENDNNNAEDPIKIHSKRLAHKQTDSKLSPVAYLIVISNKLSKSSRSRRKRSTEVATLEPIDENSLNNLRKTYKDSLKEITLNPNETPAEALMRYNAESIREALEKANKQPMEIEAGGEQHEEAKGQVKLTNEVEQQQQQQKQISQQLPPGYALSENGQYVPVTTGSQNSVNNGPYVNLPVNMQQAQPFAITYNQQNSVYDPAANQEGIYNNYIAKYNTPTVYSSHNKMLTQNPFLSMYNSLESLPYIDDYNINNQPYQIASPNIINSEGKIGKSIVYQKSYAQPYLGINHLSSSPIHSSSNEVNKNLPYYVASGSQIADYDKPKSLEYGNYIRELPPTKTHYTFSHIVDKNDHIDSYSPTRHPKMDLNHVGPQESSYENIMAAVKERLAQCCNECKDNIIKGLDETFKHSHYGSGNKMNVLEINVKPYATITDRTHTLTYRKPSKEEDNEYKQWLTEMADKGYDKSYLTRQHQRDYLKDGKLNLHIMGDKDYGHEEEKMFYKSNQSYKRETIIPEKKVEKESEAEIVTAPIVPENRTEKFEQDAEDEEEEEEEDQLASEESKAKVEEPAKLKENNTEEKKSPINIEKESKIDKKKSTNDNDDKKITNKKDESQNLNTNKTMETAESTTHSVYALRGQFRTHKPNPMPFAHKQGKQFNNYKNINKMGSANVITKLDDKKNTLDKDDKLEEILDILHDLSKHSKEKLKETSNEETTNITPNSSSYTTTNVPKSSTTKAPATPATPAGNLPLETNSTTIVEKTKKLSRRRPRLSPKSRKLAKTFSKLETNE